MIIIEFTTISESKPSDPDSITVEITRGTFLSLIYLQKYKALEDRSNIENNVNITNNLSIILLSFCNTRRNV